jgi:dihydrofolate reductase
MYKRGILSMSITMIATTDITGGIGTLKGERLFSIPEDIQNFTEVTEGHIIVFGKNTWDSLLKKPLQKRKNYILTSDNNFSPVDAKVVHSVEEVLKLSETHKIFICGGEETYNSFMPHANKLIMTHVHELNPLGEMFFPEIEFHEWKIIDSVPHAKNEKRNFSFAITTYERRT